MTGKILLFDIGGTNMRFGFSPDGKSIGAQRIVPTPQNYDDGLRAFVQVATEVLAGVRPDAIAGGVAGSLSKDKSQIYNSPHLTNWSKKDFKKDIQKNFSVPVYLENDTAMVGLGEAAIGAGKAYSIVAYFTVSTGVNGVKIEDKKLSKNFLGYEIGHQIIDYNATVSNIEFGRGELEDFISGSAIQKRTGQSPLNINDEAFWLRAGQFLSIGLYNTILHWSPEILVLGGSLMNKIIFSQLKLDLSERLASVYPETPRIEKSVLGEFGGLHGALVFTQGIDLG